MTGSDGFALGAGVNVSCEEFSGLVGLLAGGLEGRVGVDSKGETLLLAGHAVLEPPPLPSLWRDFEVQATAIEVTLSLLARSE